MGTLASDIIDTMFEADPGNEGGAEGKIEKAFVRDGKNDKDGREGEEDDHKAM